LLFKDKEKIQDAGWLNSLGRYDFVSQRPVSTPFDLSNRRDCWAVSLYSAWCLLLR